MNEEDKKARLALANQARRENLGKAREAQLLKKKYELEQKVHQLTVEKENAASNATVLEEENNNNTRDITFTRVEPVNRKLKRKHNVPDPTAHTDSSSDDEFADPTKPPEEPTLLEMLTFAFVTAGAGLAGSALAHYLYGVINERIVSAYKRGDQLRNYGGSTIQPLVEGDQKDPALFYGASIFK